MIKYFLWYLAFGFVLVTVYGTGVYIGLINKYGQDITSRGIERWREEDVCNGRNLFEKVANGIIGIIIWPARLSDIPSMTEMLHERCEELLKESKKSAT